MPASRHAFTLQFETTDEEPVWQDYQQYGSNRQYNNAGGDTFAAAEEIALRDLASMTYRVIETATGLPVTARQIAERLLPANQERKSMIKLNVKREGGKLYLYVNAKGMHDILDSIGVPATGGMYNDRPRAADVIANRTSHTISTEALLRKEYPAKYDLSAVYTEPPSIQSLQRLTESAFEQTRKILEHYQPIDISVSIQKKEK